MQGWHASLLMVAGETSGDQHGAALVRALAEQIPQVRVYGVGGERMRHAGVETLFDIEMLNGIGLIEICAKIPQGLSMAYKLLREARRRGTQVVVLIDAPGFNLSFAALAKKAGLRVVYYISPQIWAWRPGRVKKMARRIDLMLTLFPFEVPFYTAAGVEACCVGHPLVDRLQALPAAEEARCLLGLEGGRPTVALLPGSRSSEVDRLLPPMLEAVALMRRQLPTLQVVLPRAPTIEAQAIRTLVERTDVPVTVVAAQSLVALRAAQVALVASGTATLEAGLIGTPMVVVYRVHYTTAWLARWLIRVPYISLVNIVAGKAIVPELLQEQVQPHAMAAAALPYVCDAAVASQVKSELARLRDTLGLGRSAQRAAAQVIRCLVRDRTAPSTSATGS
jgi:lipid-A-disaccharide synthase